MGSNPKAAAKKEEPMDMMEQYRAIKGQYPDALLLFRFGDFYEMFETDAEVAARDLHLTLTSRSLGRGGGRVPMCGVPHYRLETYVARLVRKGHKVAICEQLEESQRARGLIQRDVIRVVTPGTHFEYGEGEGVLAALLPQGGELGLALLQLATGEFLVAETDAVELPSLLARFRPKEVLLPEGEETGPMARSLGPATEFLTRRPREAFAPEQALPTLSARFDLPTLGLPEGSLGLLAAGALFAYARETQMGFLPHVKAPRPYRGKDYLSLDPQVQRNLELVENSLEGTAEGSLLSVLDGTRTGMGRRCLRSWLLHPLLSLEEIRGRQEAVEELLTRPGMRSGLRELLAKVFDIERLTSRITSEIARPRDLISLKLSLVPLPPLQRTLAPAASPLLQRLHQGMDPLEDVHGEIERVLLDEPKIVTREGGLIREGVAAELDELQEIQHNGHLWLSRLEAEERERTGIPNLRVGFNRVFGYYLEVTRSHLKAVPLDYTRRQTLTSAERFITQRLRELEERILSAAEKANQLEYELFCRLRERTAGQAERLRRTAEAVGQLDVLCALAEVAARRGWVRPQVDAGQEIEIREGRHPVVERQGSFVPNDLQLGPTHPLLIVTGPNASGKSTFVRQAALLVLLAQMGSFIPAERARIGLVDKIFTRIGAADSLARGLSTFMVEMKETAAILRNATGRSLVILDEVGRGTGTADGICIAQAVVEALAAVRSRTLFTTHYHELAQLAGQLEGIANARLEVREEEGDVAFLYKVVPGISQKSYGIHVARLAGLPDPVVERAQALLQEHEGRKEDRERGPRAGNGGDDPGHPRPLAPGSGPGQALEERLRRIDPLRTTPFDALLLLAELKDLVLDSGPKGRAERKDDKPF
ncbi:MAG: DNA mismatch repair protein MutS [Candidatus Tectomicrobia bacterium]|uniref:DNA mismatch repair protein MutS n=1 Tax=Tectimicrobiota bacterium TaxID=2528274 RepID=A0A932FYF3_UNCTE|nr:DNA mismatch repair protein MutS [Candidatus Tectomicrobia bacterium]